MVVTGCGGHGRPRGTIVFTTTKTDTAGEHVTFYGVRPDGTGLVRLPPGPARHAIDTGVSVYDRVSSSDGKWSSFSANEGLREGLYVVRSDGAHRQRIARDCAFCSAWSPTGERLA